MTDFSTPVYNRRRRVIILTGDIAPIWFAGGPLTPEAEKALIGHGWQ